MTDRQLWKMLNHRNNYGRVATMEEISECAKLLNELPPFGAVQLNRPVNIWDYYCNQRGGGSCQ